jgi:hypothetical protein
MRPRGGAREQFKLRAGLDPRNIRGFALEPALANASLAGGDRHSRAPLRIQGFARGDFTCYFG